MQLLTRRALNIRAPARLIGAGSRPMLGWQWCPEQVDLCRREASWRCPACARGSRLGGMVRLSSGPLGGR